MLKSRVAGFYHLHNVQTGSGAHSVSYPKRIRRSFVVLKWPWLETDQAPPSSEEVKNECNHAFTRPYTA
jgi:hypothetical protein